MKKNAFKKGGDERKKKSQRRCYECGDYGHFIAECPHQKDKDEEEKKYKEKSKNFKKKYQGRAHVGQQWDSSGDKDEVPKKKGMATLAIHTTSTPTKLFNNLSDDEDNSHFCLMARGSKVLETLTSSSLSSSNTSIEDNYFDEDEEKMKAIMIQQFGKKGYNEINRLNEKLEKKKEVLHRQEDLFVLEKEKNLA